LPWIKLSFADEAHVYADVDPRGKWVLRGLAVRTDEVTRRCRIVVQTQADAFTSTVALILQPPSQVDPTSALV
jgi:hypothetical protein